MSDTTTTLALGVALGVSALLAAIFGLLLCLAKRTIDGLRQQAADCAVAEQCAEAIARLDLDAVAFLRTISQPNTLQTSFLRIVQLLQDVKPYIADQHLSSLVTLHEPVAEAPYRPPPRSRSGLYAARQVSFPRGETTLCSDRGTPLRRHGTSLETSSDIPASPLWEPPPQRASPLIKASEASSDEHLRWNAETCVYMFVRFGFHKSVGVEYIPEHLAMVATHMIKAGKLAGGTVDHVTAQSVALHWGLSKRMATAAHRATAAALEMLTVDDGLLYSLRPFFQLQIGIGCGPCQTTTLSALGRKFFIVEGREVSLTVAQVMANVPATLRCGVLVSQSVYNEVQYAVECYPRTWFDGVLLWQPVRLRSAVDEDQEEWMYTLQQMQNPDVFTGQKLYEVVALAGSGADIAVVEAAVLKLKVDFLDAMSPADLATLDRLLANLRAGHPLGVLDHPSVPPPANR